MRLMITYKVLEFFLLKCHILQKQAIQKYIDKQMKKHEYTLQ